MTLPDGHTTLCSLLCASDTSSSREQLHRHETEPSYPRLFVLLTTVATGYSPLGAATSRREDTAFFDRLHRARRLSDNTGYAKVAVSPAWQGRVMTSTAGGDAGLSFGWINRELIASGKRQPHMNAFGGEDRFWMGPEGGQFSIFFAKGHEIRSRRLADTRDHRHLTVQGRQQVRDRGSVPRSSR